MMDYIKMYTGITRMNVDDTESHPDDFQNNITRAFSRLERFPIADVEEKARQGDREMIIELGLRKHTGCQTPKDQNEAVRLWESLLPIPLDLSETFSMGTASLCLVSHHMSKYDESRDGKDLINAARCADCAAMLDATSPTMLYAAKLLDRTLRAFDTGDHQLDANGVATIKRATAEFESLWAVFERRSRAVEREELKREMKVRRAPNRYECARDGCGIQANSQRTLLREQTGRRINLTARANKERLRRLSLFHFPPISAFFRRTLQVQTTQAVVHRGKKCRKKEKGKEWRVNVPTPDGRSEMQISTQSVDLETMKLLQDVAYRAQRDGVARAREYLHSLEDEDSVD
ncbi:hypothetical protein EW146_g2622 [Bondarzewia mesenterica]|uniref:Uncharacterized protein n=1 Tax=Bondarzewia mesenterica TaxID=1095465 RepID=A0A4S4M011_9AGAM|nr:hypothetical protein EW146_g2622 [Bondarzewia mesenterica]